MKNKIIFNILSLVMILNILLLTACNIIPLNTFTKLPDNKINKNTFTQKGIPDPLICGDSKKLGLSLSKNSIINKDGLVDNITTITTNLPLKDASVLPKFDDLKVPLSRYTPTILDYVIVIKDRTKTYEKIVPAGCTSFDWDGKDNNGVFFDIGFLTVDINFKVTRNAVTSYYNFSSFSEKFLNLTIPSETNYSPTENRKVSSYMYCSCLTAPNNLALVLNTTKASTQSGLISLVNAPPLSIFNNRDVLLGQTNASNPNAPVFNVPLTTTLVNVSTAIGKLIAIDEPSCSFTPFLPENEINFNTEKIIQIKEEDIPPLDPATTKFFEVEDFKKLSDYANALQIDDNSANALYDQSKILESFLARKQSLIDRGSTDTAKMAEIDASIADINANIVSLQGSVLGELSALYNQANVLANHVNSITKTAYITPYPPEQKPKSIIGYFDKAYFQDQDILNSLSQDSPLYEADENDPLPDELKEFWEVSSDRVETIDPSNILYSSKYIFDEIQSVKDLDTDITNGVFNNSAFNGESQNLESIRTLSILVPQIKNHISLLKSRVSIFNKNYSENFEKIKKAEEEQFQSIILPLAQAMEQEGDYDENYTKKVTGMSIQSFRTMDLKDWIEWTKAKYNVAKEFANSPLEKREKVIAMILGYNLQEWTALKTQDPKAATDLINATDELISAVGIPTSYTSAALTFAGPFAKFAGKIGQVANKILSKKLPANQSSYVSKLVANVKATKDKFQKWLSKSSAPIKKATNCLIGIKSFSIKTNPPCPVEEFIKKISRNTSLAGIYPVRGVSIILEKSTKKYGDLFLNYAKNHSSLIKNDPGLNNLIVATRNKFNVFKKSPGVKIKKVPNKEIYLAELEEHSVASVSITMVGDHYHDYQNAFNVLSTTNLVPQYIKNLPANERFEAFETLRGSLGLVWHHHEGLEKMILIDGRIHGGVPHWGGVKVLESLGSSLIATYKTIIKTAI